MKTRVLRCCALFFSLALLGCAVGSSRSKEPARSGNADAQTTRAQGASSQEQARNPGRLIHVIVALCDNEYQGIVPVPAAIGNGDDPARNLYWGAGYGVKNHFRKAKDWELVLDVRNPKDAVLERAVFKHRQRAVYLVADAYRGREIMRSTMDFLRFAAGRDSEAVETAAAGGQQVRLYAGGAADLIVYVGHDGLMDFTLPEYPLRANERSREAVILACASKPYFKYPLMRTGATPLLWTTGLMAPEAYVLKAAVDGWMLGESGEQVRRRAAEAYNRYQNCGIKGALRLFASGW